MKRMDFSTPEPKPEIVRGVDQNLVDKNKQDIFKFFNITNKTKVASSVVGLGLILFFVAIYTVSFNNQRFNTLYPKDQSQASQTQVPSHAPITNAGFLLNGNQQLKVGEMLVLDIKVQTATETATVLASQIRFDSGMLEVVEIDDTNSVVNTWIDSNFSNESGVISLVASSPKGIQLATADQFSKIVFKTKRAGETTISVDEKNSHLYRLKDKSEIPMEYDKLDILVN